MFNRLSIELIIWYNLWKLYFILTIWCVHLVVCGWLLCLRQKKKKNNETETHLFVFFQVTASGKRLVAVLACVWVGVGGVGCGCDSGDGGSGTGRCVRRWTAVAIASVVDRGTGPAVARGAAVRRRVVLRYGWTPRWSCLFGARLARATQCFCKKSWKQY